MKAYLTYSQLLESIDYEAYCNYLDGNLQEAIQFDRILSDIKTHIDKIVNDLKISKSELISAMKQKEVYDILRHFGFSIKALGKAIYNSLKIFNEVLLAISKEIVLSDEINKLRAGAITVDEFLTKYPILRIMGSPIAAGFLVYEWLNMSFSGDFKNDFDITKIFEALKGNYTIEDIFISVDGFKSFIQLLVGLSIGLTFPWASVIPANIFLAIIYTILRKIGAIKAAERLRIYIKSKTPGIEKFLRDSKKFEKLQ